VCYYDVGCVYDSDWVVCEKGAMFGIFCGIVCLFG